MVKSAFFVIFLGYVMSVARFHCFYCNIGFLELFFTSVGHLKCSRFNLPE